MTVPAALAEVPHGRDPVRLLVALDGSDHARVALEVVACLPLTAADLVVLLSVADTGPATAHQLRRRQGQDLDELLRDRWAAERTAARQAVKAAGAALAGWDTPVRQLARGGPVIETIAAAAAELEASLLVVGPRGRNPLTDLLVGSVAHALLGRVHCPVLVGREPVGAPTQILLAVDGSPHGRAATRALVTYPRAATVVVTVVAVAPSDDAGARAHAETSAAEAIAALSAVGFAAGSAISVGDPGREIVEQARRSGATLVVVGSRGLGRARGLLGSVSRHVVAHAPCSVLVAPPARHGGAVRQ